MLVNMYVHVLRELMTFCGVCPGIGVEQQPEASDRLFCCLCIRHVMLHVCCTLYCPLCSDTKMLFLQKHVSTCSTALHAMQEAIGNPGYLPKDTLLGAAEGV